MKSARRGGIATFIAILTLLFLVNVNLAGCSKTDHYPRGKRAGQNDFNDHEPSSTQKGLEPESVKMEPVPFTTPDPVRDQEVKIFGFNDPSVRITGNEVIFAVTVKSQDKDVRVTLKGYIERNAKNPSQYAAKLEDINPNSDGKQRLKATAVCLDGGDCQSMFVDVDYLINGVQRRRQFSHIVQPSTSNSPPSSEPEEELPDHGHFDPHDPNNPYTGFRGEFVGLEPMSPEGLVDNQVDGLKDKIRMETQTQPNIPLVTLPKGFIPELLPEDPATKSPLQQPPAQQGSAIYHEAEPLGPPVPAKPVLNEDPFQEQKGGEPRLPKAKPIPPPPPPAPVKPVITEDPFQEQKGSEPRLPKTKFYYDKQFDLPVPPPPPKPRVSNTPSPTEMPDGDIYPPGYERPQVKVPNIPVTKTKPTEIKEDPFQQQKGREPGYGNSSTPAAQTQKPRNSSTPAPTERPDGDIYPPGYPRPRVQVPNVPVTKAKPIEIYHGDVPFGPPVPPPPKPPEPPKAPTLPPQQATQALKQPTVQTPPPPSAARAPAPQPPIDVNGELAARPRIQNPITAIAGLPVLVLNLMTGGKADGYYGETREGTDTLGRPLRPGTIIDASEQEASGVGFQRAMDPTGQSYRYGTGFMVDFLSTSAREFRRLRGYESNILLINRISKQYGGKTTRGQSSHQNGLDVDIAYLNESTPTTFANQEGNLYNGHFDYKRNFLFYTMMINSTMMKRGVQESAVHVIFVSPAIKAGFCRWAKQNNLMESGKEVLRRLFPTANAHHDHFHLRLKCSPNYPACQDQRELIPIGTTGC